MCEQEFLSILLIFNQPSYASTPQGQFVQFNSSAKIAFNFS